MKRILFSAVALITGLLTVFIYFTFIQQKDLTEIDRTTLKRVSVIDNNELIYQKQGFLKIYEHSKDRLVIKEVTRQGEHKSTIYKGQFATVLIEEMQNAPEETIFPKDKDYETWRTE